MPDPILFSNAAGANSGSPIDAATLNALQVSAPSLRSGTLPASSASLTLAMPQLKVVVNTGTLARLVTVPAQNVTIFGGASTDNYLYLDINGNYSQLAVARAAAAPATPAGTNCLCYATTNAGNTAISSVTRMISVNGILPTPPSYIMQMVTVRQTADNASLSSSVVWTDYPNLAVAINATAGNTLVVKVRGTVGAGATGSGTTVYFSLFINGTNYPLNRLRLPGDGADPDSQGAAGSVSVPVSVTGAQSIKLQYYVTGGGAVTANIDRQPMSIQVIEHP
ncbi:MAG: hypothetical protein JWO59_752 [Chloroflexi bacterium]|nr:hypothetical protein [Chloroflexota bacterium]